MVKKKFQAIYRRVESQTELDGRRARMSRALKRRRAELKLNSDEVTDNHNVLTSTALTFSGDRHGTFVGRPRFLIFC